MKMYESNNNNNTSIINNNNSLVENTTNNNAHIKQSQLCVRHARRALKVIAIVIIYWFIYILNIYI